MRLNPLPLTPDIHDLADRFTSGAILAVLVMLGARGIEIYWLGRLESAAARYNLKHVVRLIVVLLLAAIITSVLSLNWYTAFASLGLLSLILGLALQDPLRSFFAWIYILVRAPYRIGDRVKIGDVPGHDALGVRRAIPVHRSSQRAHHQVPELQSVSGSRVQLLMAALPLRLERSEVSHRIRQ